MYPPLPKDIFATFLYQKWTKGWSVKDGDDVYRMKNLWYKMGVGSIVFSGFKSAWTKCLALCLQIWVDLFLFFLKSLIKVVGLLGQVPSLQKT